MNKRWLQVLMEENKMVSCEIQPARVLWDLLNHLGFSSTAWITSSFICSSFNFSEISPVKLLSLWSYSAFHNLIEMWNQKMDSQRVKYFLSLYIHLNSWKCVCVCVCVCVCMCVASSQLLWGQWIFFCYNSSSKVLLIYF